jgi:hybrid polyketide synthase/nonribosomal peptide synthetase ACE1
LKYHGREDRWPEATFELAKHVLWITHGALAEEPYHMASLAFSRSIKNEATHISLNHLDVSGLDDDVSKVIAEQLLRQCALEEWDHQQLLWSKEPETFLDRGKLMVPPCTMSSRTPD